MPNDTVTREQMAVILYRYAQYKGYDTRRPTAWEWLHGRGWRQLLGAHRHAVG
ncbi:MAG: hypothetical protein ACLRWQ_07550 [Flavonifractor plautii]